MFHITSNIKYFIDFTERLQSTRHCIHLCPQGHVYTVPASGTCGTSDYEVDYIFDKYTKKYKK